MTERDLLKWQIDDFERTGGPVYPCQAEAVGGGTFSFAGMTLRDYFAGQAMQGMVTRGAYMSNDENIAHWAYAQADAMLKARSALSPSTSKAE